MFLFYLESTSFPELSVLNTDFRGSNHKYNFTELLSMFGLLPSLTVYCAIQIAALYFQECKAYPSFSRI